MLGPKIALKTAVPPPKLPDPPPVPGEPAQAPRAHTAVGKAQESGDFFIVSPPL